MIRIIYLILGTIAINIIASLIYDFVVGPYFFDSAVPVSSDLSVNCDANVNNPGNETIQLDSITTKDTEDAIITSGEDSLSFEDISEEILVRGSIVNEDQKNSYKYTAQVGGTYRFYTDLSSGGGVRVRISGESGDSLDYGNDALTIDLEQGKTYILSVEYRTGPCDYSVNIGVPIPMENITGKTSITGIITYQDQKDKYCYTAPTSGVYRFGTDLSAGGGVRIRISGENGDSIDYGNDALTINLNQGKTYILSVEYRTGPCDYSVSIGVPISTANISGKTSVVGSISYQDQKDKYYYTAPTNGTYRFDTNLSAGGGVYVRISGENGNSLNYGSNALTIELEAGKTYILSVEYRTGLCDYTVNIGVPIPITDISSEGCISGSITYQDQKDKFYYTAPTSGTYHFDTDLSAGGGVYVRISGENGNSLNYASDALTIDLEAGKTYILSVEYRTGSCDYTVNIGIPIPITNISGESYISGSITYQDQKDKYYYTAPTSGTYHFDTDLSAGGGVYVRISGENGNSLNYGSNALTIELEAGKTYILSVEYRTGSCNYEVFISIP